MKNREYLKALAIAISAAMVASMTAPNMVYAADKKIDKEETVYVKLDADGNKKEVTVSDWLKSKGENGSVTDYSDLTDITNVKGDEAFKQEDGKLVWESEGNDIYYQGTTDKELPVGVKVTYFLDGKEISAADLAGKSGHVKIRYEYENKSKYENVFTPFTVITGMVLPDENFSNLQVTNGKVIGDGERQIVVGIGLPGLKESLNVADVEALDDITLPDYFEVEGDVTDFELTMSVTVATPLNMDDFGIDDIDSIDDLQDSLNELEDAATQLVDGSGELADGVQTLKDSCGELIDGINQVDDGVGQVKDGADQLSAGANTLSAKLGTAESDTRKKLLAGAQALDAGISQMQESVEGGIGVLIDGVESLDDGISKVSAGVTQLNNGVNVGDASTGTPSLVNGTAAVKIGVKQVSDGLTTLNNGVNVGDAESGTPSLVAGTNAVKAGVDQVAQTVSKLNENMPALVNGATILKDGAASIESGLQSAEQLRQGAAGQTAAALLNVSQLAQEVAGTVSSQEVTGTGTGTGTGDGTGTATLDCNSEITQLQALRATLAENPDAQASIDNVIASLQGKTTGVTLQGPVSGPVEGEVKGTVSNQALIDAMSGKLGTISTEVGTAQALLTTGSGSTPGMKTVLDDLQKGATSMKNGAQDAETSIQTLAGAVSSLHTGVNVGTDESPSLVAGMQTLSEGVNKVADGVKQLHAGVNIGTKSTPSLLMGTNILEQGVSKVADGVKQLNVGVNEGTTESPSLVDGSKALVDGVAGENGLNAQVTDGVSQLKGGSSLLASGIKNDLLPGLGQLYAGSVTLSEKLGELDTGAATLYSGTKKLRNGGTQLGDGVDQLNDGAKKLNDGMIKFDEEGVGKLVSFFNEDVQDVIDRLQTVKDAGDAYKFFSGSGDDVNGNVKFIMETESIEAE